MSAANQQQAGRQAAALLRRSLPGAKRAARVHVRRAEHIGDAIWRRYQVAPAQWQVKHLRWFLEHHTRDLATTSRYDYWRTVRALIAALNRLTDWTPHLRGPWLRPTGDHHQPMGQGRRPKLPGQ